MNCVADPASGPAPTGAGGSSILDGTLNVVPDVSILPDQRLVPCGVEETILAAALRAGVPFAHACGGEGACSTCRVFVIEGWRACTEPTPKERVIAKRLGFTSQFRLACQTRVTAPVTVRRLVLDDDDAELADLRPRAPGIDKRRGAGGRTRGSRRCRAADRERSARKCASRSSSPTYAVLRSSPKRCCRMTSCTSCGVISNK
jgi:ferredoxin